MLDIKVAAAAHNEKSARRNWRQLCDPTLSFELSYYNDVIALWRSKIGQHEIPRRVDLSARDLKPYLPNLALVERVETNPTRYRWKLIGTKVTPVLGEHTGKLIDDSLPPEHVARWIESFDMMLESAQPWRFYGEVTINGRDYLIAENLYLPLADEVGDPRFIMALCRYTPGHANADIQESIENAMLSEPRGLL